MPTRPPIFRSAAAAQLPRDPRPTSAARGYDSAWRRLRDDYIRRHPVCVLCEREGRTTAAEVVDHIQPIAVAPDRRLDETNLRSLCRDHHAIVTGRFRSQGINEPRRPR